MEKCAFVFPHTEQWLPIISEFMAVNGHHVIPTGNDVIAINYKYLTQIMDHCYLTVWILVRDRPCHCHHTDPWLPECCKWHLFGWQLRQCRPSKHKTFVWHTNVLCLLEYVTLTCIKLRTLWPLGRRSLPYFFLLILGFWDVLILGGLREILQVIQTKSTFFNNFFYFIFVSKQFRLGSWLFSWKSK